jgi:hypothetical protein
MVGILGIAWDSTDIGTATLTLRRRAQEITSTRLNHLLCKCSDYQMT